MTDKELRKLKRAELLEMLIEQGRECEELKSKLKSVTEKLESREIALKEAGNIAEAALRLNDIFEVAQKAADQYIYNVKNLSEGESPGGINGAKKEKA